MIKEIRYIETATDLLLELEDLARYSSAAVTELSLECCHLGKMDIIDLQCAFALIPASVIKLNLFNTRLEILDEDRLKQVFAMLPATVKSLTLGADQFNIAATSAFATLPATVTELNFSCSHLLHLPELALQIFAALPVTVTILDLSCNNAHRATAADLARIFAGVPASVTTLLLHINMLGERNSAELATIFAAIPASITRLELSFNYIEQKIAAELALACINPSTKSQLHRDLAFIIGFFNNPRVHGINLDKEARLAYGMIYKLKPLFFMPGCTTLLQGSPFDLPYFREKLPLIFRPLKVRAENNQIYEISSEDVIAKIYAHLHYEDIENLLLVKKQNVWCPKLTNNGR